MSGMADEMARRMAEDGGAGAVPGSGGAPPPESTPPAGASNTDTVDSGGPPDTIPYARFKEVNDQLSQLRGYEQLRDFGYDPDSLGRLAAFEAQWLQDPYGTWKTLGDNLDLPQDLKERIEAHLNAQTESGSAEGEPSTTAPTPAALTPEDQARLDYVDRVRARDEESYRQEQLGVVVGHWNTL